jgi:hypothetical protein
VLAFVGLASALFITSALHGMNQLARVEFLSQAASDAAGLQIEIDHLLIRVKDAANYVNSGAGNQQLEGAQSGQRLALCHRPRLSGHTGRPAPFAGGDADSTPARAGEVARLAAIAHGQPGYAFVADTDDYPGLFGRDRQDALVLVQDCRAPRPMKS